MQKNRDSGLIFVWNELLHNDGSLMRCRSEAVGDVRQLLQIRYRVVHDFPLDGAHLLTYALVTLR